MNRVHLAFHDTASGEAIKLSQKLQAQGWQVFSSECGTSQSGSLAEALSTFTGPTLLLINDGLLHDLNCQQGLLATYREIEGRKHTHPILASSMRNGPGNVQARVLTNLERVSDVIRYMNFWQNAYLIKRRELGSTSTPESAAALAPVRTVSQEIGEFLKLVRKQKPHSVYDLIDDDGSLLLKLLGTPPTIPESVAAEPIIAEDPIPEDLDVPNFPELPSETSVEAKDEVVLPEGSEDAVAKVITGAVASASILALVDEATEIPDETSEEVTDEVVEEDTEEIEQAPTSEIEVDKVGELTNVEPNIPDLPIVQKEVGKAVESEESNTDYFSVDELQEEEETEEEIVVKAEATPPSDIDDEPTLAELAALKHKKSRKANTKQLLELIEEDELSDAFSFAESSLNADPGNAKLRYYYAVALLQAEEEEYVDVALHELGKLVKSDFAAEAHLCLGHISLDRRDYGTARRNLEAAYDLNKKVDSELTYRLGALIQDEYFEETKKAKKFLKKATKQSNFNKEDAWYRLAQIDLLRDKPAKAKQKLKKALHVSERHPFAAYDLASLYLREDNFAKANKFYLKAINANPELDTEANQAAFSLLRPVKEPEGFDPTLGAFVSPALSDEAPKIGQLTVLITGASSGIGAATARVFAEHGHRLILTGRRVSNLRSLGASLNKEFNVPIRLLSFDVTVFDETEQLLSTLPPGWNEIDVLINNAGKAKGLDFIHQGRLEHWEEMIDTNVKGLLYMIRLVAPAMVDRKQGHIINVCSTAGHEVYQKGAVYCATKHAVDAITQGARLDLHSHGIRVSQVSPAHVEETEFAEVRFDGDTKKAEKVYEDFQPLRARDVAKSIYYIAAQPEHVNVQDVLMLATQQANSTTIDRSGR